MTTPPVLPLPSTNSASSTELVAYDQAHIWHPYSTTPNKVEPVLVSATDGVYLQLADGRRVIDGMSSWWAAAHGHSHPRLVAAAQEQIAKMSHVMFGGLTHEPAINATKALLNLTDAPLSKVFFTDSGSVAVEVAIKMVLQYQRGKNHFERTRLLTWRRGYHGDTFAAMSICDPEGGMHAMWQGVLINQVFAPAPPPRGATSSRITEFLTTLESLIDPSIAAIVIEPKVQGAGGMLFHDDEILAGIRQLCDKHDILFVADEIATGFGRTGTLFATTGAGVTPDVMCVGKALTGGFMSLAATVTTDEVAETINNSVDGGALMHGPTFMANPLACAVAAEAMTIVAEGDWRMQVPRIEQELSHGLNPLRNQPGVVDVRVLGAIGVVELDKPVDMAAATHTTLAHGVWLRPFGKLVYCMPPYTATTEEVAAICAAVSAVVCEAGKVEVARKD